MTLLTRQFYYLIASELEILKWFRNDFDSDEVELKIPVS